MKKTALALAFALTLQSTSVFAASFPDVKDSYWAYEVIEQMKEKNILDGYEDGTFRPESSLTKAECAKILSCIANLPEGNSRYSDVSADAWYYDYVKDCGSFFGTGDKFEPDKKITREEFAVATAKVLGLSESQKPLEFSDADKITDKGFVSAAVENGFISGFEDGTFRGSDPLSRAQCCSMLARAFETEPENEASESEWKITKLTNTKLENFSKNVIADEKGRIILIEKDEDEVVFEINLPKGETQKETLHETRNFTFKTAGQDTDEPCYEGFTPMQLIYDEYTSKTLLFGRFNTYVDKDGNKSAAQKYVTLDFTIRLEKYTEFEDDKVKDEDAYEEPALLAMYRDKYAVVFDGDHKIYRFKADDGIRQGEMFLGKEDSVLASLSDEKYFYFTDEGMKLKKYDIYNRSFEGEALAIEADLCGTRNGKFWFWNRDEGKIFTSTPEGKTSVLYENVRLPEDCGINFDRLDKYMLVINDGKFLLYDGTSLYIMEKK